jgi:hypothetical protein
MDNNAPTFAPKTRLLIYTTPKGQQRDVLVSSDKLWTAVRKLQDRGCRNICTL